MKNLLIISLLAFAFLSCDKEPVVTETEQRLRDGLIDFTKQTLVLEGTFKGSPAHSSTSGKAKIYRATDNTLTLLIEDLKVDNGPDLRIYLAEDTAVTNFVEISPSVKNGTNAYSVPVGTNLATKKVISIWCKRFSVSFGTASMTMP